MTTPDTAAVRAWARENGYTVADRGRLPAEVTQAYLDATKPAKRPAAKKATEQAPEVRVPHPKPSPVSDDRRLVALAEEVAALTKRVEALEKAAPAKTSKASRFRRRS